MYVLWHCKAPFIAQLQGKPKGLAEGGSGTAVSEVGLGPLDVWNLWTRARLSLGQTPFPISTSLCTLALSSHQQSHVLHVAIYPETCLQSRKN